MKLVSLVYYLVDWYGSERMAYYYMIVALIVI